MDLLAELGFDERFEIECEWSARLCGYGWYWRPLDPEGPWRGPYRTEGEALAEARRT